MRRDARGNGCDSGANFCEVATESQPRLEPGGTERLPRGATIVRKVCLGSRKGCTGDRPDTLLAWRVVAPGEKQPENVRRFDSLPTDPSIGALAQIQNTIRVRLGCDSVHLSTDWFQDEFFGCKWAGAVEIFALTNHLQWQYCYGWIETDGEVVTIVQIPPVISPRSAVREALRRKAPTKPAVIVPFGTDRSGEPSL